VRGTPEKIPFLGIGASKMEVQIANDNAVGILKSGVVFQGDCVDVMRRIPSGSIDFAFTDPPYITRYRSRDGRKVINDDNGRWLEPAFMQVYRALKPDSFCVSFYGWNRADLFLSAWRRAGFYIAGHIVFRKKYASSVRFLRYQHEQAYLLAKGNPQPPAQPVSDVIDFPYTGNRLHPTQKPIEAIAPLIKAFCEPSGTVLDPFCGSGSTLVAARQLGRRYIGIELDESHYLTALRRLHQTEDARAAA
jgi:site-specific DNA-methyltransferase (adenine-specific)